MDYYINIKIQPDAEMKENWLLNKVYTKLHKAINTLNANDIGVSFPEHKVMLGKTIRVHGTQLRLTELQNTHWLGGLKGYCNVSTIKVIPTVVSHRIISRKQANMTEAKLRRLIKRGSINQDEAKAYKAKMFENGLDSPYLELQSASNGHKHRRYLQFSDIKNEAISGKFDAFGLSKTATVPWF